ncbi:MAG: metallophosphoesterase family protein, partial [Lentisphaeria bacterium]
PEEFRAACEILRPLAANPDFKFIYLPGNHDAYTASSACRASLEQAFEFLNRQSYTLEDLPSVVETQEASLLLLNEALPTPIWSSAGWLDHASQQKLTTWLTQTAPSKSKLLLGHYPTLRADGSALPRRRRLKNGEIIREALRQGKIDVSLCGHIHDAFVHKEKNGAMEICSGSLTTTGLINIIDIKTCPERQIEQDWMDVHLNPHNAD